jgi:hypothetical protein
VTSRLLPIPRKPLSLDEVIERWPMLRQSTLAAFDDCALSAFFGLQYSQGWSTTPQARGIIFHRTAAACLEEMKAQNSKGIPVGVALAILEEKLEQRDIPPEERVRVPLREIPNLRMAVVKFAKDNEFTVTHIVDIEKRLNATLTYRDDEGELRERVLSGQLDVLVADPGDEKGAIVPDFKTGWGLPPRREDSADALSYHGFFQQRFYGWLIMKTYRDIDRVTLREFYVYRSAARAATIERSALPEIESQLALLTLEFDRALASGAPKKLKIPDVAPWTPRPGRHCSYCPASGRCPLSRGAREQITVANAEEAREAIAELEVAEAVRKSRKEALRPFIEEHGPQPAKHSKGRVVYGLKTNSSGTPEARFFTPEGSDRAPVRQQEDRKLEQAMKRSVKAAEEERKVKR